MMLSDLVPKSGSRPASAPFPLSFSAPATRNASRIASPRLEKQRASSYPGSPRAFAKKQTKASGLLVPAPPRSPAHHLRRHVYHPMFGSDPRRSVDRHFVPRTPTLITAKGTSVREALGSVKASDMCPVHAYADSTTTLSKTGTAPFDMENAPRSEITNGPSVHAYASPTSTLKNTGATAFGRDTSSLRALSQTSGPLSHAYGPIGSTLKKTGGSTFGTPHVTPRRYMQTSTSRSGLSATATLPRPATAGAARPPRGLRTSVSHREIPRIRVL